MPTLFSPSAPTGAFQSLYVAEVSVVRLHACVYTQRSTQGQAFSKRGESAYEKCMAETCINLLFDLAPLEGATHAKCKGWQGHITLTLPTSIYLPLVVPTEGAVRRISLPRCHLRGW